MSSAVYFSDVDRTVQARDGETIYETARRGAVRIVGACGGRGTCGSCMVRVNGSRKWERACQLKADGEVSVKIAPRSLARVVRAEAEGGHEVLLLDSAIETRQIAPTAPSLSNPVADDDNAAAGLTMMPEAARALSETLRACGWQAELRLRDGQLIDAVEPGRPLLALAVDLGTTNVAGFLIDLRTGERVSGVGIENPQVGWGADVIARINAAVKDRQAEADLTATIRTALAALAHDLALAIGARARDIVDVAICGNTAMHHLLLGLPVYQLGKAPFVASVRDAMTLPAAALGLGVSPGADVHVAANIGGFVGGDHVTALLATRERWLGDGVSLVMDIGTNTEISVIQNGRILSASSPSGPALEGGNISSGMRAAEGAIERVWLEDGRLAIATIAEKEPIGLCGSGVLDMLAAVHQAGIIQSGGRIQAGHADVVTEGGKSLIRLADEVLVNQQDIRAIQLAKSAIRTATQMLLAEAGLQEADVDRFLIAGAFGAYISVASGIATGLFPDLPRERFEQLGNAAGLGIRQMAASRSARMLARKIAAEARYIELSARPGFQQAFLANLAIPETNPLVRRAS
ncbi:MAG: DUF4445 domain-containing protein [Alphaproteobacteria bacterium]|nr:DUF4445 domain-containing protein [Alphaproteobacteria bacterium]MDE2011518.1 DUF4445 domain-containing protein [Alphaproteobacteria bacterium]MDE2075155.1 DUF4445 domain-containing protein [Alphaproteobacteria bacterium]